MPDPGHGLSGGELGRPPPGLQLARWGRIRASIRGPRLSFLWARPPWRSAAHRSVVLSTIARSLCNRNARGRAWRMGRNAAASVDWAASQAPLVSCGGAPAAPCMLCGERPKTRFPSVVSSSGKMQSNLPEWSSATFAFGKSCPSGQWGKKPKRKGGPES